MRKTIKLSVIIAASFGTTAFNLFADLTTTLYLPTTSANPYTSVLSSGENYWDPNSLGGEFTAYLSDPTLQSSTLANYSPLATAQITGQGTGFETFCVQVTEYYAPGVTYNASITPGIVPPEPNGTPLPIGVSYLYSQFAQGILAGYDYTSGIGRETSADELQDAIWYLQGEIGVGYQNNSSELYQFELTDPLLVLDENEFGSLARAEAAPPEGYDGTHVLDLNSGPGSYNQDQLIYSSVPEPATFAAGAMLLLPLGWGLFRAVRRQKMAFAISRKNRE